ncbi:hypothetical protein AAL_00210 [Moelleriella libera RCEF 2490]|uniref:Vacuolar iron transporter Ccc1 n=1 Tax=Moelleriella libera RCEF 2490 TaxID=1081109 RepID=A0A166RMJ5_9HYPO|nr:hypothetical protein AAL_00210 [Moelleriella libera RCEF 2490]
MHDAHNPNVTRFLSDFTLGFSDGLTVPFALTAGLSSLGRTETVILAGLAELCAGSISMGVGGYLSAMDESPTRATSKDRSTGGRDEEERAGMLRRRSWSQRSHSTSESLDEKDSEQEQESREDLIRSHLEPLALPNTTVLEILATLRNRADGIGSAAHRLKRRDDASAETFADRQSNRPVVSGLSISLGYVVGGMIPLFPYFFASTVGSGLQWSIVSCLLALMTFGSGKSWILDGEKRSVRRSLGKGLQMLVFGSLAAIAAVLCVNLVEGDSEPDQ